MSKRGISPILATVLLVAFTIALAATVTNFLVTQTEQKFDPEAIITDSEFCDSVQLGYEVKTENGESVANLISTGTYDEFQGIIIKNKGSFSIRNMTITGPSKVSESPIAIVVTGDVPEGYPEGKIYSIPNTENKVLLEGLMPDQKAELKILYKKGYDTSEQIIKITPWIRDPKDSNNYIVCEESSLLLDASEIPWENLEEVFIPVTPLLNI